MDGTVISVRLPKNRRAGIEVGAVTAVTIIAAPRRGKAWQAVLDARIVTATMVLLPGQATVSVSRRCDDVVALGKHVKIENDGFGLIYGDRQKPQTAPSYKQY